MCPGTHGHWDQIGVAPQHDWMEMSLDRRLLHCQSTGSVRILSMHHRQVPVQLVQHLESCVLQCRNKQSMSLVSLAELVPTIMYSTLLVSRLNL